MSKRIIFFILLSSLLVSIFGLHSCMKDNEDEVKAAEKRLLDQYIKANNITVSPTSSGLYYIEETEGTGNFPGADDWVELSFTCRIISTEAVVVTSDSATAADNDIYNSKVRYGPNRINMRTISLPGLYEGLRKMKEGGKAIIIFPSDLGYGNVQFGNIPPYSSLIFDVELHHVISNIVLYERGLLNEFLQQKNILDDSTSTGLYYHELLTGTGDSPAISKTVEIFYKGSFLNGQVFDNSLTGDPFSFYIGYNQVIPGVEEGVKLMKVGGKAIFVIPYYLAYGAEGYIHSYYGTLIWPYSTLVYEVDLVSVNSGLAKSKNTAGFLLRSGMN